MVARARLGSAVGSAPESRTARAPVVIEPLLDGDTRSIEVVFRQLGPRTRRWRFGAAKPRLSTEETARLAGVGPGRLVLVARAGDHPIGLAHLVREPGTTSAEVPSSSPTRGRASASELLSRADSPSKLQPPASIAYTR